MKTSNVVFGVVFILLIWGAWGDLGHLLAERWLRDAPEMARVGQWGDSFGPFNAFFSACGFIVLAITLNLQRRAIREQADDVHRQRFEATFFQLLRLIRELRRDISFRHSSEYAKNLARLSSSEAAAPRLRKADLAAVAAANLEIRYWLRKGGLLRKVSREELSQIYMDHIHSAHEATISPYFRAIYGILDRLREDKILRYDEQIRYSNILRAQLTSHELSLLATNALAPVAKDLFDLLVQFRMLKYLPSNLTRKRLEDIYPSIAFQGRD